MHAGIQKQILNSTHGNTRMPQTLHLHVLWGLSYCGHLNHNAWGYTRWLPVFNFRVPDIWVWVLRYKNSCKSFAKLQLWVDNAKFSHKVTFSDIGSKIIKNIFVPWKSTLGMPKKCLYNFIYRKEWNVAPVLCAMAEVNISIWAWHLALQGLHVSTSNCVYFAGILTWGSHFPIKGLIFGGSWFIQHTIWWIPRRPPSFGCVEITTGRVTSQGSAPRGRLEHLRHLLGTQWYVSLGDVVCDQKNFKIGPQICCATSMVVFPRSFVCIFKRMYPSHPQEAEPSLFKKNLLPRPICHNFDVLSPNGSKGYICIYDHLRISSV